MTQTNDLVSDIKTVLDISSRVDERVKSIQVNQQELNSRLNQFIGEFNHLASRVSVLESKNGGRIHDIEDEIKIIRSKVERIDMTGSERLQKLVELFDEFENLVDSMQNRIRLLEHTNEGWQAKVKQYGGLIVQGIWVLIVCWLLYKFGLNSAPIPMVWPIY